MRSPFTQRSNTKGPVTTGWFLFSAALSGATMTASPQPRLKRKLPVGCFRVITTVAASGVVTAAIGAQRPFCALVLYSAIARQRANFTPSEPNGGIGRASGWERGGEDGK